jgi:hypothetical protein
MDMSRLTAVRRLALFALTRHRSIKLDVIIRASG